MSRHSSVSQTQRCLTMFITNIYLLKNRFTCFTCMQVVTTKTNPFNSARHASNLISKAVTIFSSTICVRSKNVWEKSKGIQYAKGPDLSLVSKQSTMHETVINAVVGCHYFPPGVWLHNINILWPIQIILLDVCKLLAQSLYMKVEWQQLNGDPSFTSLMAYITTPQHPSRGRGVNWLPLAIQV